MAAAVWSTDNSWKKRNFQSSVYISPDSCNVKRTRKNLGCDYFMVDPIPELPRPSTDEFSRRQVEELLRKQAEQFQYRMDKLEKAMTSLQTRLDALSQNLSRSDVVPPYIN
jgi:hypothetical protein